MTINERSKVAKVNGMQSGGSVTYTKYVKDSSFFDVVSAQIGDDENPIDVDNVDYVVNLQSQRVKQKTSEQAYLVWKHERLQVVQDGTNFAQVFNIEGINPT
ncbi:hypothetical protein Tco_0226804 [Tanacetum coccineum]